MRIALLAFLSLFLASANAAKIKVSRQDPVILKAYVDGVPTTLALYGAHVCGSGPGEERFDPDMVLFAAADAGAVQDSGAAVFAAQEHKKKSARYKVVTVLLNGIEYSGYIVAGLSTTGVIVIPKLVTSLLLGVSALTPKLLARKAELSAQPTPPGWIVPGMSERIIGPQKCEHFTFLMDSETEKNFAREVTPIFIQNVVVATPTPAPVAPRFPAPPDVQIIPQAALRTLLSLEIGTNASTHPQLDCLEDTQVLLEHCASEIIATWDRNEVSKLNLDYLVRFKVAEWNAARTVAIERERAAQVGTVQ